MTDVFDSNAVRLERFYAEQEAAIRAHLSARGLTDDAVRTVAVALVSCMRRWPASVTLPAAMRERPSAEQEEFREVLAGVQRVNTGLIIELQEAYIAMHAAGLPLPGSPEVQPPTPPRANLRQVK